MKNNELLKPIPLQMGDQVALVAPSSPVPQLNLKNAINSIRFLGLEPIVYPSCSSQHGYLSGTDSVRAADVNAAFANPSVKGIFCLRGGFGVTRLLPYIDFNRIQKNPKVFIGYSDITGLHVSINKLCGFVTYHGPMPNTNYTKLDTYTLNSLKQNIFSSQPLGLVTNPIDEPLLTICEGTAEGIITGGNLSLLEGTLGSPYEVDTKGKILFIEEVGEKPYRIDRALTALSLAGKFEDCAGILLGTFAECEIPPKDAQPGNVFIAESTLTLSQIFEEVIKPFKKPTLLNFRAGHIYPQATIPFGCCVRLDANNQTVCFK
ncbi:S66 peptidase family protein [Clostridium aminobutyricum]|uniref:LD-carboxypeptidase n=1 Tax=Clostridium aminobutyricum TaxID=33953 RepID=A0A939D769_CLOAM|nr:LD-carboxypeptidase [Clostridium aminobutyricum]MBN7772357.1 LD-carboxypeptidase [Clostridium aminobutyricum]